MHKSLELKIIIALMAIFACMVGIYTAVDMQMTSDDTVRSSGGRSLRNSAWQ